MDNDNVINGIKCPKCKDIIFARCGNDKLECSCKGVFISGSGIYGCDGDIDFDSIEKVEIDSTKYSNIDLYNACNMAYIKKESEDEVKYGFVHGRLKEGNEDG